MRSIITSFTVRSSIRIIAGYRELTGAAPLFGKWAYGFWQCKNKYQRAGTEILNVAHKYRALHIPLDNIVQDWFWWTKYRRVRVQQELPGRMEWWRICIANMST